MTRPLWLALLLAVPAAAEPSEDERILAYAKACAAAAPHGARIAGMPYSHETYFLSVQDGRPRIDLDVDLRHWQMNAAEMDAAVGLMDASRRAIQAFYARYGVRVEPVFHHVRDDKPAGKNHFVVYLERFLDRMSSLNWAVNASWGERERAMIHTHEFGHLLGLKDEYETTRAVRLGEPDNIMRNWDAPDGRLYLRQFKEILAPLCPGAQPPPIRAGAD